MPASYGINPVLNIAHLEKYEPSPAEFGNRPSKDLSRKDFKELPEFEVEEILAERRKKGRNGNRIIQYLTRFKNYSEENNEWLTLNQSSVEGLEVVYRVKILLWHRNIDKYLDLVDFERKQPAQALFSRSGAKPMKRT